MAYFSFAIVSKPNCFLPVRSNWGAGQYQNVFCISKSAIGLFAPSGFPPRAQSFKACEECGALNLIGSDACQACGHSFRAEFEITLNEALRLGAIVRGMDIDEEEVRDGEDNKAEILSNVLASGDDALIKVIKQLPEESWGRLRRILNRQ